MTITSKMEVMVWLGMWGGGTVTEKKRLESYIGQLTYGPGLDPDLSNTIVKRYFQDNWEI